ncbi:MAG: peptide chain release factor 1 [Chloroflexota bacterium]
MRVPNELSFVGLKLAMAAGIISVNMWGKLDEMDRRYQELQALLARPELAQDPDHLRQVGKEMASLETLVAQYRTYRAVHKELEDARSILEDNPEPDLAELAHQEVARLGAREAALQTGLQLALLPQDRHGGRDVIVEVRAGTGGEEAALFAGDLFRMYSRYAANQGGEVEVVDASPSEKGGFKEVVFEVRGRGAFRHLRHEAGVHRVQRVPATEASGRIHTSTASVAVLPQAEEVEVNINPEDLRVEFYRASGPGGQNVNKVSSAVRIIHAPTGITVQCQEDRSQFRNRQKALQVLRAKLLQLEREQQQQQLTQERRSQVGNAERAEKVRTYNFPQSRVTDHRIGLTRHNLSQVLEGGLDDLIAALEQAETQRQMEAASAPGR